MKKELLVESFIVASGCFKEVRKPMNESRSLMLENGEQVNLRILRIIKGPMGVVDEKTGNGRMYTGDMMQQSIDEIKDLIEARSLFGCIDHPEKEPKLADVSHIITKLWFEQQKDRKYLMAEWEILDTSKGQLLNSLYEAKAGIGTSYRGYGVVDENGVVSEYEFKGVDAVFDPSAGTYITETNFVVVAESQEDGADGGKKNLTEIQLEPKVQEEIDTMKKSIETLRNTINEGFSQLKMNDRHMNERIKLTEAGFGIPGEDLGLQHTGGKVDDMPPHAHDKQKPYGRDARTSSKIPKSASGKEGTRDKDRLATTGAKIPGSVSGNDGKYPPEKLAANSTKLPPTVKGSEGKYESLEKAINVIEELQQFINQRINLGSIIEGKLVEQGEGEGASLVVDKGEEVPQLYRIADISGDTVILSHVGAEKEMSKDEFESALASGDIVKIPEVPEDELPTVSIEPGEEGEEGEEAATGEEGAPEEEAYTKKVEDALKEVREYAMVLEKVIEGIRDYAWKCENYIGGLEDMLYELRDYTWKSEELSEEVTEKLDKAIQVIEGFKEYSVKLEGLSEEMVSKKGKVIVENSEEIVQYIHKSIMAFPVLKTLKSELQDSKNLAECENRVRKYVQLFEAEGKDIVDSTLLGDNKVITELKAPVGEGERSLPDTWK